MIIKIYKINYFSFTFNLNEKNKVPLKTWFVEGAYKFLVAGGERGLICNRRLEMYQKGSGA